MPITASAKSGAPRQLPPSGTHIARCYQIIDLGTRKKEWPGRPPRDSHEIRVSWELPNETADFGKGHDEPFAVHKTYTLSLSEKANLRHDLENWRGRAFTDQELEAFDVGKVLGAACMVTVTHVEKNGLNYANVTAVTAVPKGFAVPPAINPAVEYSIQDDADGAKFQALPDFLKEIIQSSHEWKAMKTIQQGGGEQSHSDDFEGDQLPDEPF